MADPITLDEALRKRGREKLKKELDAMFHNVFQACQKAWGLPALDEDGDKVYVGQKGEEIPNNVGPLDAKSAAKLAYNAVFRDRVGAAEQAEVDGFMRSIDELKDSVEEIFAELPR